MTLNAFEYVESEGIIWISSDLDFSLSHEIFGGEKNKKKKNFRRFIKWQEVASYAFKELPWSQPKRWLIMQEEDPTGGRKGQPTVRRQGKDTNVCLVSICHQAQCWYSSSDSAEEWTSKEKLGQTEQKQLCLKAPLEVQALFSLGACGFAMCIDINISSCLFPTLFLPTLN